jgi:hypothetical protein
MLAKPCFSGLRFFVRLKKHSSLAKIQSVTRRVTFFGVFYGKDKNDISILSH